MKLARIKFRKGHNVPLPLFHVLNPTPNWCQGKRMNRVDDHLFACHPTLVFGTWSRWEVPNPIEVKSSHDTFHDWTRGQWHAQGISTSLDGRGGALRCRYHVCIVWLLFFLGGILNLSRYLSWLGHENKRKSHAIESWACFCNLIVFVSFFSIGCIWSVAKLNAVMPTLTVFYRHAHCNIAFEFQSSMFQFILPYHG